MGGIEHADAVADLVAFACSREDFLQFASLGFDEKVARPLAFGLAQNDAHRLASLIRLGQIGQRREEQKEEGSDARDASPVTSHVTPEVTPVTASQPQRHLPVLQAMPAAAGAHAPSPPPIFQTQTTTPNPAPMDGKVKGKHPPLTPAEKHLAEQLWQHYSEAFQSRYDAPPLRDGRTNYQLASLTRSLGQQAPAVAVHYLQSNHDWYVRKGHDLGTLLADASKVRADWMAASKRAAQLDAVRARNHQPPQTPTPPKESRPAPETIRAQLAALQEKFTRRAASA